MAETNVIGETNVSAEVHRPVISVQNFQVGAYHEAFSVIRFSTVTVFFQAGEVEKLETLRDLAQAAIDFHQAQQLLSLDTEAPTEAPTEGEIQTSEYDEAAQQADGAPATRAYVF